MARRPADPRAAAEAAFKPAKPKPQEPLPRAVLPAAREQVSLRIDADVLALFQEDGPGWQDRINAALREAVQGRLACASDGGMIRVQDLNSENDDGAG